MKNTSEITALFFGFCLLVAAVLKEWLQDLWHTSPGFGRLAIAFIVSAAVTLGLILATYPIVYSWGSWLFSVSGF
jgi:hypothetical protein